MDEQLKERLIRYLDSVEGNLDKAIDFTAEQTPLYVKELCEYGAISHAIPLAVCVVILLGLGILAFIAIVLVIGKKEFDEKWLVALGIIVVTAFFSMPAVQIATSNAQEMYKCLYCPRVYIVEQISQMVR